MEERKEQQNSTTIRARAKRFTKSTLLDWGDHNVGTYASSMSFFFFMSMIPLLILLLQLLPYIGLSRHELLSFLYELVPEAGYELVQRVVNEAYRTSGSLVSASALMLFWSASRGTMALRLSLNNIYDEEESRSYPVLCLLSVGYTGALIVTFAAMLFIIFAGPVSTYLVVAVPDLFLNPVTIELRYKMLLTVLMVLFVALVYTFIPAGKRHFVRQIPGALLVSLVWNVFSYFFSIYVKGYNAYTMFYGSLGTIAIMMFWLYCCFNILLIGAFFNRLFGARWGRIKNMFRS